MDSHPSGDAMASMHDFTMASITGEDVSFDGFEGQFCVVVNVASA